MENNLFEQMATITKAHAYDIVREQNKELQNEIERLRHNMNEIKNLCNDPDIIAIQDKAIFSDFKTLLANIKVYLP